LAPLKINNLQATENRKMPRIKVFRQARYFELTAGLAQRIMANGKVKPTTQRIFSSKIQFLGYILMNFAQDYE